jgi:hypothetical protein
MNIRCSRCTETKDSSEFWKNKGTKTRHANECKSCFKEHAEAYIETDAYRKAQARCLKKILSDPTAATAYRRRRALASATYRELHHDRYVAKYMLMHYVQYGQIVKPKVCEDCGARLPSQKLNGYHHKGFEKRNWRNVLWLCSKCIGIRRKIIRDQKKLEFL